MMKVKLKTGGQGGGTGTKCIVVSLRTNQIIVR